MNKIFYYELRRAVCSWLFLAMLLINAVYAWYVLTTDIIRGIAYTAPFSVWSFCAYMGKTMPAAVITVLLVLAGYYGKKQKQAEILTCAVPVTMAQQLLIRTAVLGVCFAFLLLVIAVISAVFYITFFGYDDFGVFLVPGILLAVPCFLAAAGLGFLLGGVHQGLVYVLAGLMAVLAVAAEEQVFDFFSAGYFAAYAAALEPGRDGEPDFYMEPLWIAARLGYFAAGAMLVWWNMRHAGNKPSRA